MKPCCSLARGIARVWARVHRAVPLDTALIAVRSGAAQTMRPPSGAGAGAAAGRCRLPSAAGAARCSASESPGARSQEWCRANGAECLAVQAPGRLLRGREAPLTRAVDVAAALLPVLAPRLRDGVPYAVRASETSPTPRLPSQGRFTGQCCLHMRPCGQAPAESRVMSWQCTLDKVQAPSSTTPHCLTGPGNGRRRLQAACACG